MKTEDSAKVVMGLETEYGITDDGNASARNFGIPFIEQFLSNGARFYMDCGHPEYATPECADPWTLVACAKAGDRLVDKAVDKGILSLLSSHIARDNDDFATNGIVSWGSHESYSVPISYNYDRMSALMVPHLASRMVVCGAGGFIPSSKPSKPMPYEFCIAPRLTTIINTATEDTTQERGLIDSKGDRLHLICGESLCSEVALFVRFASTSLVLLAAASDEYSCPGVVTESETAIWELSGENGLDALKVWLNDPREKHRGFTAFDAQRAMLDFVKSRIKSPNMPKWAAKAWRIWRDNVEIAENDPDEAIRRFDWALKKALYSRFEGKPDELLEADAKFSQIKAGTFATLDKAGHLNHKVAKEASIQAAMKSPPSDTRAHARAQDIVRLYQDYQKQDYQRRGDNEYYGVTWEFVSRTWYENNGGTKCNDTTNYTSQFKPDGGRRNKVSKRAQKSGRYGSF